MAKHTVTIFRKRNLKTPLGEIRFFGKSEKQARERVHRFMRKTKKVFAGFYDEDGVFHPIRASGDYDPTRAGEKVRTRSKYLSRSRMVRKRKRRS